MAIPEIPVLFMKPSTALADPFPAPTILPKAFIKDNSADYESELALVIGKDCKNVSEADALDYLLGFTASNDISSRIQQFAQSQWGFSKSFDGACPIGPAFVHKDSVKSIAGLTIRGSFNDKKVQESGLEYVELLGRFLELYSTLTFGRLSHSDLIFSPAKIISFLSTGTTLPAGTIILTG